MTMLLLFALFLPLFLEAKEIALTFDDSPRMANGYFSGPVRAQKLIAALKKQGVKEAAFFSVSGYLDEEGRARLEAYANAGHLIANHTHTHPSIDELSPQAFQKDFLTAHKALLHFKNFTPWFRFPFLKEGKEKNRRDKMRQTLKKYGYFNAYITVNTYDWYLEEMFQREAKKGKIDLERFKRFYVNVIAESAEYYDQMALKHLRRSPKHIILLHETDTAALYVGDLVTELKKRGWKIIPVKEAYKDPIAIYSTKRNIDGNPGRIGEIAWDKGQTEQLWHESCGEEYLEKKWAKEVLSIGG